MTKTAVFTPAFFWKFTTLIVAWGLFFCSGLASANDWGPSLGPAFPNEDRFAPATEDYYDAEYADELSPEPLVQPRKARPLPAARPVSRKALRGNSRQAAFNATLDPGEVIVPQALLEAEESSLGDEDRVAPPPKRRKKPAPTIETNNVVTDEFVPAADFAFENGVAEGYGEGYTEGYAAEQGGLYHEMSPAMDGYYLGPMMMKSFGTGVMDNLTVFGGTTGFRGVLDAGQNGNFGFSEGINWAGPATPQGTVSAQLGFRAIQSNINGSDGVISSKRTRNQYFVTAGLFKRNLAYPLQGGVAFDWMDDDFYGKVQVRQLRAEISARTFSNLEYGFLGGFGVTKKGNSFLDRREDPTGLLHYGVAAQDYYLLFVRKHLAGGGLTEMRAGMTEHGDTILSASAEFPLNDRLAFNGGVTALIPEEGRGKNGYRQESWDVSVGFVFYFRGGACSKPMNACRPMFSVAENGSFFNRMIQK